MSCPRCGNNRPAGQVPLPPVRPGANTPRPPERSQIRPSDAVRNAIGGLRYVPRDR